MDIDTNIVYTMSNLSLNEEHNDIDVSFIDNINSLSIKEYEKSETFYDYDYDSVQTTIPTHIYVDTIIGNENESKDDSSDLSNIVDLYDNSPYICFGIPNKYCNYYFDDEDFIFNRYDTPNYITKYIRKNQSIDEYTSNYCIGNGIVVDYNCNSDNPDVIYAKILYIYQFINSYYKEYLHLNPIERIKYMPENFIYWVDNIVNILKKVVNDETLKSVSFSTIEDMYFRELFYGLNVIISQLTLLLSHYKTFTLVNMSESHIKIFFKIVNNMCVIIIFIRVMDKDN